MVGRSEGGDRAQKKAAMRAAIQAEALRMFTSNGFDATTVTEIAEAVGVSHMTVYRHFPTKESIVLDDDYDPLIAEVIAAQPLELSPVERVRQAMASALDAVVAQDRDVLETRVELILATPALRATFFDQHAALEALIAEALSRRPRSRKAARPDLAMRVVAAACASTMATAVLFWGENKFVEPLPQLMDQAFVALMKECGR